MTYPVTEFSGASILLGPAAIASGDSVTCSNGAGAMTCVVAGMQGSAIGNGVVASITFTVPGSAPSGTYGVAVTSPVAVTLGGSSMQASGVGGSVTISAPPALSHLSCSPSTVSSPGSSACTVTLTSAALTGGASVALSSNNANVTVPPNVTVPAGSTTATFTAAVANIATAQTATLTASYGGGLTTFQLNATPATYTISGTISPAVGNVTVSLSGASSQTTTSTNGSFSFSGVLNGSYVVTPGLSGYVFTPASQQVVVSNANPASVSFTDAPAQSPPAVDIQISADQKSSSRQVATGKFTTHSTNQLLLAFVSTDAGGTTVSSLSGGGLTWTLVRRTNVQVGTAEIWRAFAAQALSNATVTANLSKKCISSLTVMSFAGVNTSGANGSGAVGTTASANSGAGAPSASLVTSASNSLVVGVGENPKAGVAPVPLAGQALVHQFEQSSGTYWVQSIVNAITQSGATATLGDSSPANYPYNLTAVEVLAAAPAVGLTQNSTVPVPAVAGVSQPAASSAQPAVTMFNPATGAVRAVCSPGALASLSGTGFTSQPAQSAESSPLPTRLAGVRVTMNGEAVGLSFASASRINLVCPAIAAGSALDVAVETERGLTLATASDVMEAATPGIFTVDATNQGVIQIAAGDEIAMPAKDGIRSRPAKQGEILAIYAIGLGPLVPDDAETPLPGNPALPGNPGRTHLQYPVRVVVGSTYIDPLLAGPAPGSVGLYHLNLALPSDAPSGPAVPVRLEVNLPDGSWVWSNTVNVAIQ